MSMHWAAFAQLYPMVNTPQDLHDVTSILNKAVETAGTFSPSVGLKSSAIVST